jgi:glycosyltransferase involved in cell wall biosynthesis
MLIMTNPKPFFSIIIPALNEAKYLPHLLADLTKQTFQDFEVVVVDGKSDDQTVEKAKLFARKLPRLTIVYSPRRHVCTQRNLGAQSASADTLIFSDADNRLPPYFLQGIKYRLESSQADLATCWLQSDKKSPKDKNIATLINYGLELTKASRSYSYMEAMTICTKSAFITIGGFNEGINVAEGRTFKATALNRGLSFQSFKDPVYTYSFRRIRKFGALKIVTTLATHELIKLIDPKLASTKAKELYPMIGGQLFSSRMSNKTRLIKIIKPFFQELRKALSS